MNNLEWYTFEVLCAVPGKLINALLMAASFCALGEKRRIRN